MGKFYNDKLFSLGSRDRKHAISKLIGYLVPQIVTSNGQQQFEQLHNSICRQTARRSGAYVELLKGFKALSM